MKNLIFVSSLVAVSAVFFVPKLYKFMFRDLQKFDQEMPFRRLENIWDPSELESLRSFMKTGTFKTMPRNTAFREREVRLPPDPDTGRCPYEYLIKMGDFCAPIGRLDSLIHLARFGGIEGSKESVKDLMNTVHVFQMFQFGQELQRPEIHKFMSSSAFKLAAQEICGQEYGARKEVQVNLNILLPGQQLPMHFDVPYFHAGGIVQNFPLWLLAVMQGSGFWDNDIPPHVQGQAYLHMNESISGGNYFFFPKGPGGDVRRIEPVPNSALLIDGSRVMHGVEKVMPERKAPPLFDQPGILKYEESKDIWEVRNELGDLLETYKTSDLRMTFIWRSLCFKTEEEKDKWNPKVPMYKIDDVLKVLEDDLRARNVLGPNELVPSDPLDYAFLLIDEYVKYPIANLDNTWIPFNYRYIPYTTSNSPLKKVLKYLDKLIFE